MARSTKAEMRQRYDAVLEFAKGQNPVTVRQIYYNLASKSLVSKDNNGYQKVARACQCLRRSGTMPWEWVVDNSRWQRKPTTYNSIQDALLTTARTYRRSLWTNQGCACEVWVEKDALAGIFYDITYKWDVPLMVSGGFSSETFLREAAMAHRNATFESPTHVFLFSDYDAAGFNIYDKVKEGFRYHAPNACINVIRSGLTKNQVEGENLVTRSAKLNDIKAGFDYCCDLDAVPPNRLRAWVELAIKSIVDENEVKSLESVEEAERESFMAYAKNFPRFNESSIT